MASEPELHIMIIEGETYASNVASLVGVIASMESGAIQ
jgi:hypothetical protein